MPDPKPNFESLANIIASSSVSNDSKDIIGPNISTFKVSVLESIHSISVGSI